MAAAAALGNNEELQRLAHSTSFKKIPPAKIRETLLEIHLFAGFPAAIEAFTLWRNAIPNMRKGRRKNVSMSIRQRKNRGTRLCRRVYGAKYAKLIQTLEDLDPELANWILEDGYGKVLSRPGLSLIEREFIAIAVLAATGWTRQLNSHIQGSLNAGGTRSDLWRQFRAVASLISLRNAKVFQHLLMTLDSSF